jgi:hypothetical protein
MHPSLRCPILETLGDQREPITYSYLVCSVQGQALVLQQIPAALAAQIQPVVDSSAVALLVLEALEVCRRCSPALESSAASISHDAFLNLNVDKQHGFQSSPFPCTYSSVDPRMTRHGWSTWYSSAIIIYWQLSGRRNCPEPLLTWQIFRCLWQQHNKQCFRGC